MTERSSSDNSHYSMAERDGEMPITIDDAQELLGLVSVLFDDEETIKYVHGEFEHYDLSGDYDFRDNDDILFALKSEVGLELSVISHIGSPGTFSITGSLAIKVDRVSAPDGPEIHFKISAYQGQLDISDITYYYPGADEAGMDKVMNARNQEITSYDADQLCDLFESILNFDDSDIMDR